MSATHDTTSPSTSLRAGRAGADDRRVVGRDELRRPRRRTRPHPTRSRPRRHYGAAARPHPRFTFWCAGWSSTYLSHSGILVSLCSGESTGVPSGRRGWCYLAFRSTEGRRLQLDSSNFALPSCHAASTHVSAVIRVAAAGAGSGGICDGSSRRRFGGENMLRTNLWAPPTRVGQSSRGRSGRFLSACSRIQPDSEAHVRCHATSSAR